MHKLSFLKPSNLIFFSLIIFIVSRLGISQLNAQAPMKHHFHWEPVKTISLSDSSQMNVLAFKNAKYNLPQSSLPYYEETLPLPSGDFRLSIEVKNIDLLAVSPDTLPDINGLDKIPSAFSIETQRKNIRKQAYASIKFHPLINPDSSANIFLINEIQYNISYNLMQQQQNKPNHQYASNSVLAQDDWYKLKITSSGIYKLTYDQMNNANIPVDLIDPTKLQMYGNGGQQLPYNNADPNPDDLMENAIYVHGANDGSFDQGDYILFYAKGPHTWKYNVSLKRFTYDLHEYDEEAYYFLTFDRQKGKRVNTKTPPSSPSTHFSNTYNSYRAYEKDSLNLIGSGRRWFGDVFDIQTQYNYSFTFPELNTSKPVRFRISLAARHTNITQFALDINNNSRNLQIAAVDGDYLSSYARSSRDTFSLKLNSGKINMNVSYQKPVSSALGWMDFIEVNAREYLKFKGKQLDFRDVNVTGNGNIAEYTISNASSGLKVWDVTDHLNPVLVDAQLNGNQLKFKSAADTLRNFVAHKSAYYSPQITGKVKNQNLHGLSQTDMVIVHPPAFKKQAEELAEIHRNRDNLVVHTVKPNEIYNEFSSGQKDVTAIRNFMRMFYDRAGSNTSELPDYLLLFGDGTYDPKNLLADHKNTIITFQSSISLSPLGSFVSDDYFGLFDPGEGVNAKGSIDLGIGRLPVDTETEAQQALNKIKRYIIHDTTAMNQEIAQNPSMISGFQDWRNIICFVSDDEDGNLHMIQADNIASDLQNNKPAYNIEKIYFDAYKQEITPGGQRYPEANKAINERVQKGALIINYVGHGGETGWAHEEVLRINDINNWDNKYNLPIFMTATCEFSRFDDPERVSAGEYVFLNPEGGAISLFTTSRVAFASNNASLNKSFYNNLFKKKNGEASRMGDLMRYSKIGASTNGNPSLLNFVLLGDPALQPAFPEKTVVTTSINQQDTSITDTLAALSEVTVQGQIINKSGNLDSTFNGILYPTVYDKASSYTTLGQDKESNPRSFKLRDNILYKGKASIKQGEFSFKFVIPKDISYNFGEGKISYYAENGITDANGYYDNFIIGGTSPTADNDQTGPEIELYMNDFSFESGDITDENPILLAKVFDEHGINTVGNGIGHDIVAILDKNTEQQVVLNDYYEADLDNFKQGLVRYPYSGLSKGKHTLTVKVWDVYNNSNEATIEFVVKESANVQLKNLTAYPNPSSGNVWFTFDHNQAFSDLKFKVEIFNLDGRLIETLQTSIQPDGYSVSPLKWDGRSASGTRVEGGMYIYRATIRTGSGISKQKSGKIVIFN